MTALWIILGIFAFFALLLFFPVRVWAKYEDSLALKIRYLLIAISVPKKPLSPEAQAKKKAKKAKKKRKQEEKKQKKAEKKKKKAEKGGHAFGEKKKKTDFKEIFRRHGVSGFLSLLKDALRLLKKHFKKLRHIRIDFLSADLTVAKGNAADTAIEYGKICAVFYPAIAEIMSICRHGKYEAAVTPDFNGQKSTVKAEVRLSIRLFWLVSLALGLLFGGIRLYLAFKRGKYEKKKQPAAAPDQKSSPASELSTKEHKKGGANE